MNNKKLIYLIDIPIIIAVVTTGFYFNLGDNHSKSIPDATSHGEQYNGINNNITSGMWSAGAPIGTKSLAGGAAAYLRNDTGWLYYIGGDQDFSGNMTARTEAYNAVTNSWSVRAQCPTTIEYTGCARLKDTIYIIGGMVSSYFSSETAAVQKYNIRTNTWSTGVPLPQALGGNKAAAYQDSIIFSAGGMNAGGSNAVNIVYVFNSNTNVWRTGTALPAPLMGGAFTVSGDSLFYVGGGASYYGGFFNLTYKGVLNATDKSVITWTTVAIYPGPSSVRFDAAPWGKKGIIIGAGSGNSPFGSSNECYVLTANTWIAQPNMIQAVGSAGIGSVIYSTGIGKFIIASGEDYPASPYTVNNCQIFTDTVSPPPPPLPFLCEGFNSQTFPPAGWTTNGGNYWSRATVSAFGLGTGSAMWDNYSAPNGTVGNLITLTFPPSTAYDSLKFALAYCYWPAYPNDSLNIYTSIDGGTSYNILVKLGELQLNTVPNDNCTHPWTPMSTDWGIRSYSIPIGTNKIMFQAKSGFGDHLYLDTIGLTSFIEGSCWSWELKHRLSNSILNEYILSQNYPNPFNPSTLINFSIPKAGNVELRVYDVLGKEIAVLVDEFEHTGEYSVEFDGTNFASGIYFYKLKVNDFISTKKMLLIK